MTLRQTAQLGQFGEGLITESGAETRVRGQVLAEAGPRSLSDIYSSLDTAGSRAQRAFTSAEGTLARRQRGLGRNLTDRDKASQQRRIGLSRALSTVDARNREVGSIRKRQDFARSAASDLRSTLEGQVLSGRSTAAGAEVQREADYQRELQDYKKRKAEGLGTIAAIGLSFVPGGAFLAPAVKGAISGAG